MAWLEDAKHNVVYDVNFIQDETVHSLFQQLTVQYFIMGSIQSDLAMVPFSKVSTLDKAGTYTLKAGV